METRVITPEFVPYPDTKEAVGEAVKLLQAGEVVALPTETVYGLAADALNPAAVAKIFEAKERPTFDPLIVHLPHKKDLPLVADVPPEINAALQKLTDRFWPGPLTIVLPKKPVVPDLVTAGLPSVAVRVSANSIFKKVAQALGRPLAAPSANRFGSISPTSASAVEAELGGRIPLIIDGGATMHGLESTIIKIEPGTPKALITILRPGPVTLEDLKLYGKVQTLSRSIVDEAAEAPGQLASHYAPRTPLRLLSKPSDFIPEPGKRYALMSYRGETRDGYIGLTNWVEVMMLSPGKGKLPEAAVRFFYILRALDNLGVDEIIAEPLAEHGVGVAMMDRLRRASHAARAAGSQVARPSQSPLAQAAGSLPPALSAPPTSLSLDHALRLFNPRAEALNKEQNLPHWKQPGAAYFVTFHLADALPKDKRDELSRCIQATETAQQPPEFLARLEDWLDAGEGECLLEDPTLAGIVDGCLRHFDGTRYDLLAWVVMPNHVHVLVQSRPDFDIGNVLHTWMSSTTHEINKTLGRQGPVWQQQSHQHLVCDPDALWSIADYIVKNPLKAGVQTSFVESRVPNP